ncbi:MAG TPA: hypothetical protein VER17_05875 [Tepidisphaeraceae bacterium]|nr:hypothetical protein [Tepidisphaeraceae bacterium]
MRELQRLLRASACCVLATLLLAAAPAADPAAPRAPVITVTKADGTTARGMLVSADPAAVTLRASAKAEPVAVPWDQIKRVSNGLTRPQVLAKWKADHPNDLCADCKGAGAAACATCRGSGHDQSRLSACDRCGGAGVTAYCTRCEEGTIDCPRTCLKLTQGRWYMKEGKRWRDFRGRGGTMSISEHHVGELIEMENGNPVPRGACPTCAGTTRVACATCDGAGLIACDKCHFAGTVGPPCPTCREGQAACATCKGDGIVMGRKD